MLSDKPRNARGDAAKRSAQVAPETDEDSDQFEKMDVDQRREDIAGNEETDEDQPSTPQPLEEEQLTSTDDEGLDLPHAGERVLSAEAGRATHAKRTSPPKEPPPPRRELPFTRRVGAPVTTTQPNQTNGDTEETDGETDDEL
jgi:hypothetical protein